VVPVKTSTIRQSPKRPAEQRRRELLTAARRLFMKNGYRETSMDHIAAEAGLTKGALYFHFTSKEDILFQLVQSFHQEMMEQILALPRKKTSPAEVLRILLEAQHGHGAAPFDRFLDFWLQASKIPAVKKILGTGITRDFHKIFAEVIDPDYASSPRDRRDLGTMVLAAAEGLSVRKMMGDHEVDFSRQLKLFAAFVEDRKLNNQRS
jgi:AcrR family transcriptional regulator